MSKVCRCGHSSTGHYDWQAHGDGAGGCVLCEQKRPKLKNPCCLFRLEDRPTPGGRQPAGVPVERCTCTHMKTSHWDAWKTGDHAERCGVGSCDCGEFSPGKIASPAGRQAALKAWETRRSKKARASMDHDDLMVYCNTDNKLYPYSKAVRGFLGIEENQWGEDVVEFNCDICLTIHHSRVLGRR